MRTFTLLKDVSFLKKHAKISRCIGCKTPVIKIPVKREAIPRDDVYRKPFYLMCDPHYTEAEGYILLKYHPADCDRPVRPRSNEPGFFDK